MVILHCDECKKVLEGVMSARIYLQIGFDSFHFCSIACLSGFTSRRIKDGK